MTTPPTSASRSNHLASLSRLDEGSDPTYLLGLDEEAFLDYLSHRVPYGESTPNFPAHLETVLVHESVFDTACERFASAVQLASILATDDIRVHLISTELVSTPFIVGENTALALSSEDIQTNQQWYPAGISDHEDFFEAVSTLDVAGDVGVVSVPPIWSVTGSAGSLVGDEYAATLHVALESTLRLRHLRKEVTEYYTPILAGAVTTSQFYNIGRFGETVGIASPRTLQRRKKDLEGVGIVTTKRIRVRRGRPRHQLELGEEWHQYSAFSELLIAAEERI